MKLLKTLLPLVTLLMLLACSKDENDAKLPGIAENKNKNLTSVYPEAARLEFPKLKGGQSIVLVHRTNDKYGVNFCTEWDTQKKSQRWSCYQMHAGNYGGNVGRYKDGYPYDDQLDSKYYFNTDLYWSSGYQHGHICPSADRQYSTEANRQTFFLTNMQPQRGALNEGPWQAMENQVRTWVSNGIKRNTLDTLYVCRGGTIDRDDQIKGLIMNQMIIPKYFFMALLSKNASGYKALAFWIEHKDYDTDYPKDVQGNYNLSSYVTNIRELETLTGIDFFCNLDDETENHVETLGVENIKSAWGLK